ncbi:hypothetical protein M440DRAFT_1400902 [Trichoderma longibrachiatum ATCC 18648]|uniref:Uncharacterized protein n=1 Tax=Trichoderma longibrachiatum ATCC 18648 TaxID=983965 RepID=A0A2T4C8Q8_TRILO|nr:hypothetical protein M440DRAFT_1400902 [Trichoderma longibrachiatum ATCC 18648]
MPQMPLPPLCVVFFLICWCLFAPVLHKPGAARRRRTGTLKRFGACRNRYIKRIGTLHDRLVCSAAIISRWGKLILVI